MITAPRAPLWYASVKMSEDCDARVELVSHEMSAIHGVVAKWRLLGPQGDETGRDGNDVLASSAAPVTSSSEKCTNTPLPIHRHSTSKHSATHAHTLVVPLLFLPTIWYDIV